MKHTDEEIIEAVRANGSQRKAAAALGINSRTLERRLKKAVRNPGRQSQVYVITAAVNATPVHKGFWAALEKYREYRGADLLVIPMRYKNPTSREEAGTDEWWALKVAPYLMASRMRIANTQILGDIKIQPTAINPVQGWKTVSGQDHAILGHTKVALDSVATCHGHDAKLILTTGACTVENYSDTNAGAKGKFHHIIGAVVLEVDGSLAHIRHIIAEPSGAFIDLDKRYTGEGVEAAKPAEVLVMGDVHAEEVDESVLGATGALARLVKPKSIVGHDVLNFGSASHHNRIWDRYRRHVSGTNSVLGELSRTAEVMDTIAGWSEELVMVGSNHHDHFLQWLEKSQNGEDLENAIVYHETKAEVFKAIHRGDWLDPFKYWMDSLMVSGGRVKWLKPGESFMRHGIEYGYHGHKGPNGARGSTKGFATIGAKVVKGHSHGAQIIDGARSVGTTSKMNMGYNVDSPSGWTASHDITYANGKQTLVHCVNGRFFL